MPWIHAHEEPYACNANCYYEPSWYTKLKGSLKPEWYGWRHIKAPTPYTTDRCSETFKQHLKVLDIGSRNVLSRRVREQCVLQQGHTSIHSVYEIAFWN